MPRLKNGSQKEILNKKALGQLVSVFTKDKKTNKISFLLVPANKVGSEVAEYKFLFSSCEITTLMS